MAAGPQRETITKETHQGPLPPGGEGVRVSSRVVLGIEAENAVLEERERPHALSLRTTPPPLRFPPDRLSPFFGRADDLTWANGTLEYERRIEFYGADKMGKTALLRRLAHDRPGEDFDVLVYAGCRNRTITNIGQQIADRLCLSAEPGITELWPSGDLHKVLLKAEGLIELDDAPRDDDEVNRLTGEWFQNCRFIITSSTPHHGIAWNPLFGLHPEDGAPLIERASGRRFSDEDRGLAVELSSFVEGHPGYLETIGRSLHLSGDASRALTELMATGTPGRAAAQRLLEALTDPIDRLVAAVVVILRSTPVPIALISQITGVDDAEERVQRLVDDGYLARQSPEVVATLVLDEFDTAPFGLRPRVLAGFARWALTDVDRDVLPPLVLRMAGLIGENLAAVDWKDVLTWTRAVDRPLVLSGAWDAWHLSASLAMVAAVARDDDRAKGWALHQLGTRALCLGARRDAETLLHDALDWRRRAGDSEGAELTMRNLKFIEEDFVMVGVDARPLTPLDAFGVELPELGERISAVAERVTTSARARIGVPA